MSSDKFFVLSLVYSTGDWMQWWGPHRGGYVTSLAIAGQYTAEEIAQHRLDDGVTSMAVPVDLAMSQTRPVVHYDSLDAMLGPRAYLARDKIAEERDLRETRKKGRR